MNVIRPGSTLRLRISFAARPTATRSRDSSSVSASSSVIRSPSVARSRISFVALEDALVASIRRARAEPEQLAFEASLRYGYPAGFLARYFEKLRYRFGPRERAGLFSFLELARDAGELETVPELRFVADEVTV